MTLLVCGSMAYDTIMRFEDQFSSHMSPGPINISFLAPHMRREFGGCAGNIAYNLKLLDVAGAVVPMAAVGKDFAPYAQWLDTCRINRDFITVIDSEFTAQAFITTDIDGNQITVFHPGAMNHAAINSVSSVPGVSVCIVSPDGREAMLKYTEELTEAAIPFIFDPGQQVKVFTPTELMQMIHRCRWMVLNRYEWKLFGEHTGTTQEQILKHIDALIITHGSEGSTIHTAQGEIRIPVVAVGSAVDPTGCGDAYRAGLLYGLVDGMDWETIGRIASLMGAIKIASLGAQGHHFLRADFDARFHECFGRSLN